MHFALIPWFIEVGTVSGSEEEMCAVAAAVAKQRICLSVLEKILRLSKNFSYLLDFGLCQSSESSVTLNGQQNFGRFFRSLISNKRWCLMIRLLLYAHVCAWLGCQNWTEYSAMIAEKNCEEQQRLDSAKCGHSGSNATLCNALVCKSRPALLFWLKVVKRGDFRQELPELWNLIWHRLFLSFNESTFLCSNPEQIFLRCSKLVLNTN